MASKPAMNGNTMYKTITPATNFADFLRVIKIRRSGGTRLRHSAAAFRVGIRRSQPLLIGAETTAISFSRQPAGFVVRT